MTYQSCPDFPSCWTPEIEEIARKHALDAYPNECAGYIDWDGKYNRMFNHSKEKHQEVVLSDYDMMNTAQAQAFFHSHPDGIGCPSKSDMEYQMQLGIPFITMVTPRYDVFCHGETLGKAPLLGRSFRHGVHDCFALLRDWYLEKKGMFFPDIAREWEWWLHDDSLYLDNFQKWGFKQIRIEEATVPGDVVFFNFSFKKPMHAAIVDDDQLLMHHISGSLPVDHSRISTLVPRIRMMRLASMAVRHAP